MNFTVVPTANYLILAAALFCLGMLGVLIRRNALVVFMCIELMLNAANLTFLAFARERGDTVGHISPFFIIAVAAAEAGCSAHPPAVDPHQTFPTQDSTNPPM